MAHIWYMAHGGALSKSLDLKIQKYRACSGLLLNTLALWLQITHVMYTAIHGQVLAFLSLTTNNILKNKYISTLNIWSKSTCTLFPSKISRKILSLIFMKKPRFENIQQKNNNYGICKSIMQYPINQYSK